MTSDAHITLSITTMKHLILSAEKNGENNINLKLTHQNQAQPNQHQTKIRIKQVIKLTGLKKSSLYRRYKKVPHFEHLFDPTFPQPKKLGGGNINVWCKNEILNWINNPAQ